MGMIKEMTIKQESKAGTKITTLQKKTQVKITMHSRYILKIEKVSLDVAMLSTDIYKFLN